MILTHTITPAQVDELMALYEQGWWSRGRKRADVEKMLSVGGCLLFALVDEETGRLAAFARVLSDYVYKALILDVLVQEGLQDRGLGRKLLDAILSHEKLEDVRHFELYCRNPLIPYYEQWGFTEKLGEISFMRRVNPA